MSYERARRATRPPSKRSVVTHIDRRARRWTLGKYLLVCGARSPRGARQGRFRPNPARVVIAGQRVGKAKSNSRKNRKRGQTDGPNEDKTYGTRPRREQESQGELGIFPPAKELSAHCQGQVRQRNTLNQEQWSD